MCGEAENLDRICEGDNLPFTADEFDFVIASHVLEHFYDLIGTLKEWIRVVKPGGLVFVIFPHKDRTFDKDKHRTTLKELLLRCNQPPDTIPEAKDDHHTIWITEDALELCRHMVWRVIAQQNTDDKVGNGFTFVIQK